MCAALLLLVTGRAQADDPTKPPSWAGAAPAPSVQRAAPAKLELSQILHGATPVAVINGQAVSAGNKVDGWLVERIVSDRVIARKGNRKRTLVLAVASVKRPAADGPTPKIFRLPANQAEPGKAATEGDVQ